MAEHPAPRSSPPLGSRWWLNLALAVLVVALAVLLWHARSRQGEDGGGGPTLLALAPEDVARIRLERPNAPDILLEKADGGWRLRAPVEARVNDFNLRQLLRIARLRSERKLAAATASDYGGYGLDRPQARVWLNDEVLAIGALHPLEGQYYVLYRDAVHLVASHAVAAAFYDYTQFLDTRLLEEGLELVALKLPGFALRLEEGTWRRLPPIKDLSSDRINDFIAEWRNAHALRVARPAGSRRPQEWVTLEVKRHGRLVRLQIGILARTPELVLVRADERLEYHFPQEMGKRLLELGNP